MFSDQVRLTNNLICNNTSSSSYYGGGGVSLSYTSCEVINNTICNNSSEYGGGLSLKTSRINMNNTIIWGNIASIEGDQIYCYDIDFDALDKFNADVRCSDIEDGLAGVVSLGLNGYYMNNIDQDPDFVDPANDFQLASISSPCVDAGSFGPGSSLPETDLAGNQRVSGSQIDIGAYEFQSITPDQPGAIIGETSVCQGSPHIYIISPVSGATSYTWTLPSGWSGSSASTSITATAGAIGGIISVTAGNLYGTSILSTLSVSVTALPAQPGAITGETSVCQGSSQTYNISPVSGATTYTWTLPSGWSGSSASTSITATAGATGGTISVTANNSCGTSTPGTLSVSVTMNDISKIVNEEELMICYPNPASDILNIIINSAEYNEYYIELYDNIGIKCNTYNFNDKHLTIDLTNYPPASYLLRLIEHNGICLSKAYIIKTHK
jgi:hypothetical protein